MADRPIFLSLPVTQTHTHTQPLMHIQLSELQETTTCSWPSPLFTGLPNVVWHMLPSWGPGTLAQMERGGAQHTSQHLLYPNFLLSLCLCMGSPNNSQKQKGKIWIERNSDPLRRKTKKIVFSILARNGYQTNTHNL